MSQPRSQVNAETAEAARMVDVGYQLGMDLYDGLRDHITTSAVPRLSKAISDGCPAEMAFSAFANVLRLWADEMDKRT